MAVLIRFLLIVIFMCHSPLARAESLQLQEQEIKAGLLYNFLKYTDWPESTLHNPSITVCVLGSDPFDGHLQPMAGRTVNHREITIRPLHTISDAINCQLLFINSTESNHWPELKAFLKGKSVLTVSDFSGFAEAGGMIEFGHKNDHISAELNMDAATAAQLNIENRLLKLVTIVHAGGGTP